MNAIKEALEEWLRDILTSVIYGTVRVYYDAETEELSGITPHDFRHTFASVLYEVSGGDLQLVRKKLRHKDATTTANIYVDLRSDREDEYDLQIEI